MGIIMDINAAEKNLALNAKRNEFNEVRKKMQEFLPLAPLSEGTRPMGHTLEQLKEVQEEFDKKQKEYLLLLRQG